MKTIYFIVFSALLIFETSCGGDKVKKQTDQNYTIGAAKMEVKDYKGAVSAFSKCIALNPNNYDAYHQRALAYKAMDNKKNALYNYKMAQTIMEKHEDLTDASKHAEYQNLLQEIKDYTTAADVPAAIPSDVNTYTHGNTGIDTGRH